MGRRLKFTREVHEQIVRAVAAGVFPEIAARMAGISESSFYRFKRGSSPERVKFRNDLNKALAEYEARLSASLTKGANDNPRVARDVLAYRFPSRWHAKRSDVEDPLSRPVGSHADADELVIIDPATVEDIVARLLASQRRQAGGPVPDVSRFERPLDSSDVDAGLGEELISQSGPDPDHVKGDIP
jgi:hypothetical protein